MLKDEYKIYEEKMKKSIESVANDFAAVRAGRANASVLNRIHVDYYGTPTPIQQIASVASAPTLCPAVRGRPRCFAPRPLPSIIIAMWRGRRLMSTCPAP